MAAWFWANDVTNGYQILGISDGASAATRYGIELRGSPSALIQLQEYDGANFAAATTSAGYSANTWQHVAAVVASTTSRSIYLNGGNAGSNSTLVNTPPGLNTTSVGCWILSSAPGGLLSGRLAEVAFWSAALDADEIAALAKGFSPLLIRPQSLAAYWPLVGNDSPEPDRWKNRYDLTLTNAPAKADHPRLFLPSRAKVVIGIAQAAVFAADATGSAAITATLAAGAVFSATVAGSASLAATLTTGEALRADATGTATTTATLRTGMLLPIAASGTATTTAVFAPLVPLGTLSVELAGAAARVRIGSVTITDVLNDAPNTCTFTVDQAEPIIGADVQITVGIGTVTPLLVFAGTVQRIDQVYEAQRPANLAWGVTCQDYTRTLNRRKVRARYVEQSATDIALDLVATYTTGFTAAGVAAALPTVPGGIDITEEDVGAALTRLAARIGGYWYVDYRKDVHFFVTETTDAPDALTAATPTLFLDPPVTVDTDSSQIRTRVYVEGGGANAGAAVAAGTSTLPVQDPVWYEDGDTVVSGPQRITYAGVVAGGAGALIGTTVTPTNGPTVTPRAATGGQTAGVYGYEATFVTASGETKPSPTTSITLGGAVAAPASAPTVAKTFGGNLSPGVYQWKLAYLTAAGETLASAPSAALTMDDIPAPSAIGTASETTSDAIASYSYKFTFTNGVVETTPSPASNTIMAGSGVNFWNASARLTRAGNSTPPAGWDRKFYRTPANSGTYKQMGGPSDGFWSDDSTYYYDSTDFTQGMDVDLGANAPTVSTAIYRSAQLTGIVPSSDPLVTTVRIYRTAANGSTFKKVADISNGTTTYSDTLADASLGSTEVGAATALYLAADLSSIPVGPSGTTSRKVYRTVANGSTYKLLTTIANNTTTTFTDTTADASLGATAPTVDTSGLVTQSGDVAAGSTTVLVTSTAPFQAAGGWAFIGALAIRYTGLTGDALTGVPATGIGGLTTTVRYGSEVIAAPMLIGIPTSGPGAILYDILDGDQVNLLVQCDDLVAQAELAALEGGDSDGIYEHYLQDRRLSFGEAQATGYADLALFSRPLLTVHYDTRDPKTRSGKTVPLDLPELDLAGDVLLQTVRIMPIPNQWPRFSVEASSVRFSFEDMLRRLRLTGD